MTNEELQVIKYRLAKRCAKYFTEQLYGMPKTESLNDLILLESAVEILEDYINGDNELTEEQANCLIVSLESKSINNKCC